MDIENLRRRLRLRDLETLSTVVRAGGIRKAATLLHLSQPAVSKAISDLEDTLGVPLLVRGPRGVEATDIGRALARRGEAMTDNMRSALREVAELADPDAGEVRIGSMETLVAGVLGAAIDDLMQTHPRVRLVIESGQSPSLIAHFLQRREVDLVVARPWPHEVPADLRTETLFHDRLLIVCSIAHPFARRRRLGLADLMGQGWVLSLNETLPGSPLTEALAVQGLTLPSTVLTSGSLFLRMKLLARRDFVTCMPHSLMPYLPNRGDLKVLPIDMPAWRNPTAVITLRDRDLPPAARLLLLRLRERVKDVSDQDVPG